MALTAKEVDTSQSGQQAARLKNCEMALDSLAKVILNNNGTEIQCNGHYKLLFSLLRLTGATQLQLLALEVCISSLNKPVPFLLHVT